MRKPGEISTDDLRKARAMRNGGYGWEAIFTALPHVPEDRIKRAIDPGYRERRNAAARERRRQKATGERRAKAVQIHQTEPRPDPADVHARLREIPPDTRDLTGRLLGDPLPGRRAIDEVAP